MEQNTNEIAIIGMDCIFPGAPDLATFWDNLRMGVDSIEDVPDKRWDPVFYDPESAEVDRFYCRRGGFIDRFASFRTLDFGVMPVAAQGAEPDQLLGLQVAHGALKDAGYVGEEFPRERTAVILGRGNYIGAGMNRLEQHVRTAEQLVTTLRDLMPQLGDDQLRQVKSAFREQLGAYGSDTAIGLVPNLCASRIANRLNLHGSAYTVDGACASSLLALDHGVRELRSGRADMVLVGGIHLSHDVAFWSVFCQLGALSRTEQIRPFSQHADGILIGEGLGFVVLKRAEEARRDGDRIYSIVRGVGVSSDGRSASLMSPSQSGQLLALERAWEDAALSPQTIGMVEAHGTATPVGDEVELDTLQQFFGPAQDGAERAVLGSVKSMIGHAMPAAGMAGLIKSSLALYEKTHLPTLHCEEPVEALNRTRFRVLQESVPWKKSDDDVPRRAAVNAFGFGGINAHVVLEESGQPTGAVQRINARVRESLLLVQAPSKVRLREILGQAEPGSAGLVGEAGPYRVALINPTAERLSSVAESVEKGKERKGRGGVWISLSDESCTGGIAFLYPGIEAHFAPEVNDLFEGHSMEVPPCLRPADLEEHGVGVVQLGRALTQVAQQYGIQPTHMAGHSVGEWTAMIASGMLEADAIDALIGGFEAGSLEVPGVTFLSIGAGIERVEDLVSKVDGTYLSHDNCPHQCVAVGPDASIIDLESELKEAQILAQRLPFQSGFHSPLFSDYLKPHRERFAALPLGKPRLPVWSATHVAPFPEQEETVRRWALEHLVQSVRFREVIEGLYEEGVRVFIQMGVGSLPGFITDTLRGKEHTALSLAGDVRSGMNQFQRAVASLFVAGVPLQLDELWKEKHGNREMPLELGVPLVRMEPLLANLGQVSQQPLSTEPTGNPVMDAFMSTMREAEVASRAVMDAYEQGSRNTASAPGPSTSLKESRRDLHFSIADFPALMDHTFFHQPDQWPILEDRYPVVPMTALIEHMKSETESVSAGDVAVRLENVRARKWMAVEPPITVEVRSREKNPGVFQVSLGEYTEGKIHVEQDYPRAPVKKFNSAKPQLEFPLSVENLYPDRWMFHGPAYQGIVELNTLTEDSISGRIKTGEAEGALLDNAGQLLGLWVMCTQEKDRLAMPVQIKDIRLFGPHPKPGTLVDCTVHIRQCGSRQVIADIQCWVGDTCWADIRGWEDWRFETDSRLWPMLQFPDKHLLAEPIENSLRKMDLRGRSARSLEDLSRRFLGVEERARWSEMKRDAGRDWLAGRIAAIDAVRSLLFEEGEHSVFPVQVQITNDSTGCPRANVGEDWGEVYISIAHKDGIGIATASRTPEVGVDLERIEERTKGFESLAFTEADLKCLPGEDRDEWLTRAWCGKEARGKAKGTGLQFSPKSWSISEQSDERLCIDEKWVETRRDGQYVIAWTREERT